MNEVAILVALPRVHSKRREMDKDAPDTAECPETVAEFVHEDDVIERLKGPCPKCKHSGNVCVYRETVRGRKCMCCVCAYRFLLLYDRKS